MSTIHRRAFYVSTYPIYISGKNKIKWNSKTIIQKEDSLPQGCSSGWGSSTLAPRWLKEFQIRVHEEQKIRISKQLMKESSTSHPQLRQEKAKMYEHRKYFSSFSFANTGGERKMTRQSKAKAREGKVRKTKARQGKEQKGKARQRQDKEKNS